MSISPEQLQHAILSGRVDELDAAIVKEGEVATTGAIDALTPQAEGDLVMGGVNGAPEILAFGGRSASLRGGPTKGYWKPSEAVMPEDYLGGNCGTNGTTDVGPTLAQMVTDAKAGGSLRTGTPLVFTYRYKTSQPLVLPRSGATPSNVVHVIGKNVRSSMLEGLASFPANRALIEWEQPADVSNFKGQISHQVIRDLTLHCPLVAGTKAIWHQKTAPGWTLVDVENEWFSESLFENILIEADNRFHQVLIDLEIGLRYSALRNIYADPARSEDGSVVYTPAYDTLLLRVPSDRGGTLPYRDEDSVGIGHCELSRVYPMIRRGGYNQAFQGRMYQSFWDGCFCNGGRYDKGSVNYWFTNSVANVFVNLLTEGRGETAQFRFDNCDRMDFHGSYPVAPINPYPAWQANHAYVTGDLVSSTSFSGTVTTIKTFQCTTPGISGAGPNEPAWSSLTDGQTVTDGTVVWTVLGDGIGPGIIVNNSRRITWHGRFARPQAPSFAARKVKAIVIDANSAENVFTDFDLSETTSGAASSDISIAATPDKHNLVAGMGVTSASAFTPYVVGWHPHHEAKTGWITKTATGNLAIHERQVKGDATAGNITLTLPTPVGINGVRFSVKKSDSSANTVTLATAAGTIQGAATKVMSTQWSFFTVESDGTRWLIVANG